MRISQSILRTTISLCIVLLLVLSTAALGCNKDSTPESSKGYRLYTNSEYGFSLEYPRHWSFEENTMYTIVTFESNRSNDYSWTSIKLVARSAPSFSGHKLEDAVSDYETAYRDWYPDYETTYMVDIDIDGRRGIRLESRVLNLRVGFKTIAVFFTEDNTEFSLQYFPSLDMYSENFHHFQHMLDTFKFQ